jgi:hypothetical protein
MVVGINTHDGARGTEVYGLRLVLHKTNATGGAFEWSSEGTMCITIKTWGHIILPNRRRAGSAEAVFVDEGPGGVVPFIWGGGWCDKG